LNGSLWITDSRAELRGGITSSALRDMAKSEDAIQHFDIESFAFLHPVVPDVLDQISGDLVSSANGHGPPLDLVRIERPGGISFGKPGQFQCEWKQANELGHPRLSGFVR